MPDLTAVFFDMDGTLVDTARANFSAYAMALKEVGVTVGRRDFEQMSWGRHWRHFLPELMAGVSADPADVAARKQALYPEMMEQTRLNLPVAAMARLMRKSIPVGLVTTASRRSALAVLGAHQLTSLFDVVVTGDDVAEPKPSPEGYLQAAATLGVAPVLCLAVEDSDTGMESARRAGMTTLRVETFVTRD